MSVEIVELTKANAELLDRVAVGVFDEAVRPDYLTAFLSEPSHHMMLAVAGQKVVGMVSLVVYLHPDKGPNGWINEVGVGDDWLRQGIGRKLMGAMLDKAEALGCEETWLGTEPENSPARGLYRSLDWGEEAEMVMYTYDTEPD